MKHVLLRRQLTISGLFLGIALYVFVFSKVALAYSGNGDLIVHVTNTGECYHNAGCSYLKSDREMPLEEAYLAGYRPCSRCKPPAYTGTAIRGLLETDFARGTAGQRSFTSNNQETNNAVKPSGWIICILLGIGGTVTVIAIKKTKEIKKLREELQCQQQENEKSKQAALRK